MFKRYGLALLGMVCLWSTAALAEEREGCKLCGMYIAQYQATAATVQTKGGTTEKTCGAADMLRLVTDAGGPDAFAAITVRDWPTGKELPAATAAYVIGGDLVPDMIPNIIAFADEQGAKAFMAEHGGQMLTFSQALLAVSPMGMTMPTRVNSAVPSTGGSMGLGAGYMDMVMDELKMGSDEVDRGQFLAATTAMGIRPNIPRKMESSGSMVMASYGITDRLALSGKISDLRKTMTSEMRPMGMGVGREMITKHNGISDLELKLIYNLWRDDYYSKFVSVMGNATLPTGDFDVAYRLMPGLQLGTGDINVGTGLLGSLRFSDFWLHGEVSYLANRKNRDHYKFGDVAKLGLALHYTPTYDLMFGVELDGTDTGNNENNGLKVANSGGRALTLTGVANWRFLSLLGGNLSLSGSYGAPLYQDVNLYGLGTDYAATAMLTFRRRLEF